jgi:hypothetical protein
LVLHLGYVFLHHPSIHPRYDNFLDEYPVEINIGGSSYPNPKKTRLNHDLYTYAIRPQAGDSHRSELRDEMKIKLIGGPKDGEEMDAQEVLPLMLFPVPSDISIFDEFYTNDRFWLYRQTGPDTYNFDS